MRERIVSEFEHGKVQPQAVDLEEAILGAILLEKDALASIIDILRPEMFYKDQHKMIYQACLRLFGKSDPVDILTVTQELKKTGDLEVAGGTYYIIQLTNRVSSSANTEYHAHIIIEKFILRELIRTSSELIQDSFDETMDTFEILERAEQELFKLGDNNIKRSSADLRSLLMETIKHMETAHANPSDLLGVPSGYREVDRLTCGWQRSDLIILASRPGMGKTSLALSMARNLALDFNIPVAFFSLEMSSLQLAARLLSLETEISSDRIRRGDIQEYEWGRINSKTSRLLDAPIYIDDTPSLSVFEFRAKCRRLKSQHNIQIAFVDYLQLMKGRNEKGMNREQEISNISQSLKAVAKELNIPVIALSQLSRAVETRGQSKRPVLSDLRESGAIEQDADIVAFIYRPEYYGIDTLEDGTDTKGLAILNVAKHRNGALRDINLRFIPSYTKFIDYDAEIPGKLSEQTDYRTRQIPEEEDDDDNPF